MRQLLFATLIATACLSAFADDIVDGAIAYEREDYAVAFSRFLKAAERGEARAQYLLGELYRNGKGVTRDNKQAVDWFTKAAEQGNAFAQANLGSMYHHGLGVPVDEEQAVFWNREAAEQGSRTAQSNLAGMYYQGKGVPRDNIQAYVWWSLAAGQGDESAAHHIDVISESMNLEQISEARQLLREWKEDREWAEVPQKSLARDSSESVSKPASGAEPGAVAELTISRHGTVVRDRATGLSWRRCAEGQNWNGESCAGMAIGMSHANALLRARVLEVATGVAWRLPNNTELQSITTDNVTPLPGENVDEIAWIVDRVAFPDTPPRPFWTSSTKGSSPGSFAVWFGVGGGMAVHYSRTDEYKFPVRLVSAAQVSRKDESALFWLKYPVDDIPPEEISRTICGVQERLSNMGFSPGPINGRIGSETEGAIDLFLKDGDLQEESISLAAIRDALKDGLAVDADRSEPNDSVASPSIPKNGKIFFRDDGKAIAPLEVKTAKQGNDYFIKVSELGSNRSVLTFYLRSGSSVLTDVPPGTYTLKYATGTHWFGEVCLFGIESRYNKADRDLNFVKNGNQVNGFSIELILQKDGNLATKTIPPEDW